MNFNHFFTYFSEVKLLADITTSSCDATITGIFRHPGDFSIRQSSFIVSCNIFAGHISIFVTTTKTGTFNANASPRCSGERIYSLNMFKRPEA